MAPANTGTANNNKIVVIKIYQVKRDISSIIKLIGRIFIIVVMKLIVEISKDKPS